MINKVFILLLLFILPISGYICGAVTKDIVTGNRTAAPGIHKQQPVNKQWLQHLLKAVSLTQLAKQQYTKDQLKYHQEEPYQKIIPQVGMQLKELSALLRANGATMNTQAPITQITSSPAEAYLTAMQIEHDIINQLEWLIANTDNETARKNLEAVSQQAKDHYKLFKEELTMYDLRIHKRRD